MKKRIRDLREADDAALLKSARRRFGIDFISWETTPSGRVPKMKVNGLSSTLHSVRPAALVNLPTAVLDSRALQAEFYLDFWPKNLKSEDERNEFLQRVYDMVHRRLDPRQSRYVADRAFRKSMILSEHVPTDPESRIAQPLFRGPSIHACTVYFGHKLPPAYLEVRSPFDPWAQLKVYLKVSDNGKDLPRSEWRVRLEVTLNSAALQEVMGVSTVRDLIFADYRALAREYFRFARPEPAPLLPKRPRKRAPLMARLAPVYLHRYAQRRALDATKHGNFTQFDDGWVTYKTAPELTRVASAAADEHRRALNRARSAGKSGRPTRHPSTASPCHASARHSPGATAL